MAARSPRDFKLEAARRNELARRQGFSNYYAKRVSRAEAARPGISRRAARGHPRGGERSAAALIRAIRRMPKDGQISFMGTDRQADGTWNSAWFGLLPGDEEYTISQDGLYQLSYIADVIAATGITVLGAKYLASMITYIEEDAAFALGKKQLRGLATRYVVKIDKAGRARTSTNLADALIFDSHDAAARFSRKHGLERRGYEVIGL